MKSTNYLYTIKEMAMRKNKSSWFKRAAIIAWILPLQVLAAEAPVKSAMENPVIQVFLVIIAILAVCIVLLANVLVGAAQFKMQQLKETREKESPSVAKFTTLIILIMLSVNSFAADVPVPKVDTLGGIASSSFYALLGVVLAELFILFLLSYNLKILLRQEKISVVSVKEAPQINIWVNLWEKINSFRPVKEETQIDLGHDYDGIRELDNRLPPWWLYGFYACIVFAVVYLWQHEVVHSAPSSIEEYTMAMQKGEEEKEIYLKNAASNVDENTVKLLADEGDLTSGKAIFTTVCAACHAADGGGLVGPNLTDDYWLHGGSVKDIFKTIKYGWQEKGMKSWKDDYTPVQIAQLSSYIKSLHGKTPAKAKEPQGVLFNENEKKSNDSLMKGIDTSKIEPGSKKTVSTS